MFGCSRTSDISCSTKVPEAKRAQLQKELVYVVGLFVAYQEVDYMEHSVFRSVDLATTGLSVDVFGC